MTTDIEVLSSRIDYIEKDLRELAECVREDLLRPQAKIIIKHFIREKPHIATNELTDIFETYSWNFRVAFDRAFEELQKKGEIVGESFGCGKPRKWTLKGKGEK